MVIFLQMKQSQLRRQQLCSTGDRFKASMSMAFESQAGWGFCSQVMELVQVFCSIDPWCMKATFQVISFWRWKWAALSYHPVMVVGTVSMAWMQCINQVGNPVKKYEIRVAVSLTSSYLAQVTLSLKLLMYSVSCSPESICVVESQLMASWVEWVFPNATFVTIQSSDLFFSVVHLTPLTLDLLITFTLSISFFNKHYQYTIQ